MPLIELEPIEEEKRRRREKAQKEAPNGSSRRCAELVMAGTTTAFCPRSTVSGASMRFSPARMSRLCRGSARSTPGMLDDDGLSLDTSRLRPAVVSACRPVRARPSILSAM
jgi:hypothetical protein